jgi:hypothetical protein
MKHLLQTAGILALLLLGFIPLIEMNGAEHDAILAIVNEHLRGIFLGISCALLVWRYWKSGGSRETRYLLNTIIVTSTLQSFFDLFGICPLPSFTFSAMTLAGMSFGVGVVAFIWFLVYPFMEEMNKLLSLSRGT